LLVFLKARASKGVLGDNKTTGSVSVRDQRRRSGGYYRKPSDAYCNSGGSSGPRSIGFINIESVKIEGLVF